MIIIRTGCVVKFLQQPTVMFYYETTLCITQHNLALQSYDSLTFVSENSYAEDESTEKDEKLIYLLLQRDIKAAEVP